MAKTARDVMTPDAQCVGEDDSVTDAAKKLAELGVGAMPICGNDDRLKGVLTDRDIVVEVLAQGKDPDSTKAGEIGDGKPVTIGADDSVSEALKTMKEHTVRRLPVIDGHDLVGIVSIADLAQNIDDEETGRPGRGDLGGALGLRRRNRSPGTRGRIVPVEVPLSLAPFCLWIRCSTLHWIAISRPSRSAWFSCRECWTRGIAPQLDQPTGRRAASHVHPLRQRRGMRLPVGGRAAAV